VIKRKLAQRVGYNRLKRLDQCWAGAHESCSASTSTLSTSPFPHRAPGGEIPRRSSVGHEEPRVFGQGLDAIASRWS
jgi:hypothetical protein